MRTYDADFITSLTAARADGIAPAYFLWLVTRDLDTGADDPIGLWSGTEDLNVTVTLPDGSTTARDYIGGVGLRVEGLQQVGDLTDHPVTAIMSQIADAAQEIVRGRDVRLAYCEIHVTTMIGGAFTCAPQLEFVGIVDEAPVPTPGAGGEAGISLTMRDEIISQLTSINPAKSSDAHQRRRSATDRFCEYASTITSRSLQWFKT